MKTFGAWLPMLLIAVALEASSGVPQVHYHRYALSDYRKQHRKSLQNNYLPVIRPTLNTITGKAKIPLQAMPDVPMVRIDDYGREVMLYEILLRVYLDKEFKCMATLVSEQIAITIGSCFSEPVDKVFGHLTIKTSTQIETEVTILHDENKAPSLLLTLILKIPLPAYDIQVKFCSHKLEPGMTIYGSTYLRKSRTVHMQLIELVSLKECREKLNDHNGKIVTDDMICAKNNVGKSCQNSKGNPLIYDGMFCGINLLGHNCPDPVGVDLYAAVLDELVFIKQIMEKLAAQKFDDAMP